MFIGKGLLAFTLATLGDTQRHLRKIDWLMACTDCLVCLIRIDSGHSKKRKEKS